MEVEIKLNISRENALLVFEAQNVTPLQIFMETTYFADKARLLEQNKMMLRLRLENQVGVCTFKAPLPNFGGMARLEIEAPAKNISQGVAAILRDPRLPLSAKEALSHGELLPACGAVFTRLQAVCHGESLVFMLSFDDGRLYAGEASAPISEMELELITGDFAALTKISNQICAKFGACISEKSKAQRAFELI